MEGPRNGWNHTQGEPHRIALSDGQTTPTIASPMEFRIYIYHDQEMQIVRGGGTSGDSESGRAKKRAERLKKRGIAGEGVRSRERVVIGERFDAGLCPDLVYHDPNQTPNAAP